MAVVTYGQNGKMVSQRAFMVPKRAGELKYWYKAAHKAIGGRMPSWDEAANCPKEQSIITVESIILSWRTTPDDILHTVVIDRKRQLL
jgi:hypothetical protein